MKRLFALLFILISFYPSLTGQSYFPKGASWIYHAPTGFSSGFSYTTLESKGDSIFNGDTLTYLEGTVQCAVGNNEFIKQIGEKIYKLNKCDSTFSLLYDFGANVGDTIHIIADKCQWNDSILLIVDSIVPINLNNVVLNHFFVTQLNWFLGYDFGESIIQGIGNTVSFYPMFAGCDPVGGPLRCYHDSIIGEYNTGLYNGICDTVYIANGTNAYFLSDLSIYPNPTTGVINIDLGEVQSSVRLLLLNCMGQMVHSYQNESMQYLSFTIDVPNGLYLLRIELVNGYSKTIKLIKK